MKERSVEIHPSPIHQIVCERKARVLAVLFSHVLLDSSRANGSNHSIGFDAAIRKLKGHEERTVATLHSRADTLILEGIISFKVALNRVRPRLLRHATMVGRGPRDVMTLVTINAFVGVDVIGIEMSGTYTF